MPLPIPREQALAQYYAAERRAGACPIEANERMAVFADRLDRLYAEQLQAVKTEMEYE